MTLSPITNLFSLSGRSVVIDSEWHFVSFVVSEQSGNVSVSTYWDCDLIEVQSGSQINRSSWSNSLFIGKSGANQRAFEGFLKSFKAFSRALSAEEIKTSYLVEKK